MLKHLVNDTRNKINALVRHKACNHRYERRAPCLGKPQFTLQAHLVVNLAFRCRFHVVVDVDLLVRLRIVDRIIDPIDNPKKVFLPLAQESIEMLAVIFVLDLLGIGLADG